MATLKEIQEAAKNVIQLDDGFTRLEPPVRILFRGKVIEVDLTSQAQYLVRKKDAFPGEQFGWINPLEVEVLTD